MSADPPTSPTPPPLQAGDSFAGRFEILGFLGSSGTSDIYRAKDLVGGGYAAVKLIKGFGDIDPKILEKYQSDLAIAGRVSHEQLVRILESAEHKGYFYVAVEYVDGESIVLLAADQKRLPMSDFLSLFRRMCESLVPLHEERLAHGDLSFSKFVLAMDGTLRLMEFGIGRYLGAAKGGSAAPYLSPEQIMGRDPSPASDVYSLGALAFELLTGRKPFDGIDPAARAAARPPQIPMELQGTMPSALAPLIEKCLDPDPAKRYPSVRELLPAIAKIRPRDPDEATALAEVLPEDPPDPREALSLFRQMIDRVVALRATNQTFGDLSPRNFRIRENGDVELSTKSGEPREPKYMSPEDIKERPGLQRLLRAASDNYILGFVFYEVLVGTKLFASEFSEVLKQEDDSGWYAWHPDPLKAARPLKQVVPSCPPALSDVVASMMEKRFDSRSSLALTSVAEQFKKIEADLEKAAARRQTKPSPAPTPAAQPSPAAAPGPPPPMKKLNPLVLGGVAAIVVIGAFAFLRGRSDAPPPTGAATAPSSADLPAAIETSSGTMLLVPAGDGPIGDPPRPAKLPAFYIDKFEVTNAQYRRFCDATKRAYPRPPAFDAAYFDKSDYPVLNVSWQDARDFASWAGKRLPTGQEWERAARGADGRRYPWGSALVDNTANLPTAGRNSTAPAGWYAFDLSAHGALDMGGNVAEWIEASAAGGNRIICGGSYRAGPDAAVVFARTTVPPGPSPSTGFRCAANPEAALKLRQ